MIPYGRQTINDDDIASVVEVLRSDWLTQGQTVPRFEEAVKTHCGAAHAVASNSATGSLHLACLALGVGPGDWVWTSPITFVASSNCALYCGAQVDFVDIDPRTFNMSVDALEEKLIAAAGLGRLPKVVIPVHMCGQSCDMQAIAALGQKYGFRIIEDASHAIGARYQGKPVGDCRYSDITVFSFHPVKIITTGEGGLATTNDADLAARMFRLRSHGITNDRSLMEARPAEEIWNYQQIDLGYNYRMTDIHAALGLSQMTRLEALLERRHRIVDVYENAFEPMPVIRPWQNPETYSSFHLYVVRIRESLCGKSQKSVYQALQAGGVGANLHYIPVYLQPYYAAMGFKPGYCPEAELYFRETITLPIYPLLTDEQQAQVISVLSDALAS